MRIAVLCATLTLITVICSSASANLLANGHLDETYDQEIVPGFFLPKPYMWENVGTRAIGGPYEDELSSEPWAGPAPTPVTTNGFNHTTGVADGQDWGVFFKPFTGTTTLGAATGHLYQDTPGNAGWDYTLTGWAGAEANALLGDAVIALEFLDAGGLVIGGAQLSLLPTLFVVNGEPFNYKLYSLTATAPAGTVWVRSRDVEPGRRRTGIRSG